MHAYIHTYIHACMHTYIHTCIHAYIHTHVHTEVLGRGELKIFQKGGTKKEGLFEKGEINTLCKLCRSTSLVLAPCCTLKCVPTAIAGGVIFYDR